MPLPALLATRVAYHEDGSVVSAAIPAGGTIYTADATQARNMNGHGLVDYWTQSCSSLTLAVAFPYPRNLRGLMLHTYRSTTGPGSIYTSTDTTTGHDGTWVDSTVDVTIVNNTSNAAEYRTSITSVSVDSITGIQIRGLSLGNCYNDSGRIRALHVYADSLASTATDRLQLWHPTLDQPLSGTDFDFGDVPRGSVITKTFRVKNVSSSLTANTVGLGIDISTDSSPTITSIFQISDDDSTYGTSLSLGNLAAGALSSVLYARYSPTDTFPVGAWAPYIEPSVGSWT